MDDTFHTLPETEGLLREQLEYLRNGKDEIFELFCNVLRLPCFDQNQRVLNTPDLTRVADGPNSKLMFAAI